MHLCLSPFAFPAYLINSPTFPPIPIISLAINFPHLPHLPLFFSFCFSFFCFSEYYNPFKFQKNNFWYDLFSLFSHIYSPISFTLHLSFLSVLLLILFSIPWPDCLFLSLQTQKMISQTRFLRWVKVVEA